LKPNVYSDRKKKPADFAAKLLKNSRDVKERAALEVFIARELYGLSLDDWKHLTGTFTFGSGRRISVFRRRFELCPNKRVSLTPRFNEGLSEAGGFSNRF
jgi:hypothetical protein